MPSAATELTEPPRMGHAPELGFETPRDLRPADSILRLGARILVGDPEYQFGELGRSAASPSRRFCAATASRRCGRVRPA
jgi:hypothetical protein